MSGAGVDPGESARLGGRALWALVPWGRGARPEGAVLADSEGGPVIDLPLDEAGVELLRPWAARKDRVFLLDVAKPELRRLLRAGVDVARPLCRQTLDGLLHRGRRDDEVRPAADAATARDRAWGLLGGLDERLAAVEQAGLRKVARLECLVVRPFAALEERGLFVDVPEWKKLVDDARQKAQVARREVFAAFGDAVSRDLFGEPDLNLEADLEVKAALERLLGQALPDVAKGTLGQLGHEVGPALLRYREASKVVSTYGESFLAHVDPRTSRVHATFIPLGASTGRVASRDPNLQNLPGDAAFHRCLRAPEGRALITAD